VEEWGAEWSLDDIEDDRFEEQSNKFLSLLQQSIRNLRLHHPRHFWLWLWL
jgi:hypothetical protein